jgi:ABC-type hemin transport system ATPase subunit
LPGGRIYGLLGRNGSGKTSLLSALAGFRRGLGLTDFMAHPRTIVISTHLIDELSPLFEEVLGLALEGVTWALVRDIPIRSRVT